jgi:hypothetical protein
MPSLLSGSIQDIEQGAQQVCSKTVSITYLISALSEYNIA